MEIQISLQKEFPGLNTRTIERRLTTALDALGCSEKELSVLFTDDDRIAQLNEKYLGRKGATNVLAFPMTGKSAAEFVTPMLGDVVISVDTAMSEADIQDEDPDYTVTRLLVHGVLHLLGYDHTQTETEALKMEEKEHELMDLIWGEEPYGTPIG